MVYYVHYVFCVAVRERELELKTQKKERVYTLELYVRQLERHATYPGHCLCFFLRQRYAHLPPFGIETNRTKKMSYTFEIVAKMIQLIERHRCLWDIRDPLYLQKDIKERAYADIAAALGSGFTGERCVRKRMVGTRGSFRAGTFPHPGIKLKKKNSSV